MIAAPASPAYHRKDTGVSPSAGEPRAGASNDHVHHTDWNELTALGTLVYGAGFLISLILVWVQLRRQADERFIASSEPVFTTWLDDDFQRAQQWVLWHMQEHTWRDFVRAHRGDYGERAFLRVGAYYNRVGYLVVHHLIRGRERILLELVASTAVAVWRKVEPLVLEARRTEDARLFQYFEQMLPDCRECYVPGQGRPASGHVD
jgi:hypothetical protein